VSGIRPRQDRGFSLLELLVVMVVLAIMTAVLVPMATQRMRMAKIRTQVNQFTLDLRAARWTAVSTREAVNLVVKPEIHVPEAPPNNFYEYTDVHGRTRRIEMPEGVRIVSSTDPIEFLANGSVAGGSSTVIEAPITVSKKSTWTITTNAMGVPHVVQQQVDL
jgi:prepilin-type N-terminal cleavage/methylation domain-containing protein